MQNDLRQPRLPAGNSDGGRWTDGSRYGGSSERTHEDAPHGSAPHRSEWPDRVNPPVFADDSIRTADEVFLLLPAALAAARAMPATAGTLRLIASLRNLMRRGENKDTEWMLGSHKSQTKWENQMHDREWTRQQISDAIKYGKQYKAPNNVTRSEDTATRYDYNGKFVVRDNQSKQLLQISRPGKLKRRK